jgi:hypothetical protein
MSKDGYFGSGESQWLDPCTLMKVEKHFRDLGYLESADQVRKLYDQVKAQLDQHIKYSKVHG